MLINKPETCIGCPLYEKPHGKTCGFVPSSGDGKSGVMILGEAAGENEETQGEGFVGKAGYYLFQNLKRVGIDREGFRIANVIKCRPSKNLLVGAAYEEEAIAKCSSMLVHDITDMKERCKKNGKSLVVLTLGRTAFKAMMGFKDKDPIMHKDYIAYPFWSSVHNCWVVPAYHPSYLMRGNTHLMPVLQFAATRALEIAKDGFKFIEPNYELDPNVFKFTQWVEEYIKAATADPNIILAYDIETPFKSGADEADIDKEEDDDYTILRCSFSYRVGEAVSVQWNAQMRPALEKIFGFSGTKAGWNNLAYDRPRILAQMPMNGAELDGMLCWHVLNSALPKGLGFVAPYYAQQQGVWKYLSDAQPALYNAVDSDVTLRCILGIKQDLIKNNLWDVLNKHVTEVHKVFSYMSNQGVLIDQGLRQEAEDKLSVKLASVEGKMEEVVPKEAREVKIYKTMPKVLKPIYELFPEPRSLSDVEKLNALCKDTPKGLFELVKDYPVNVCTACGLERPDRWKKHRDLCGGTTTSITIPQTVWGSYKEFKLSKKRMMSYQGILKHQAIVNRKEGKTTFDEKAILQLLKKYPNDSLYPLILEHRSTQKLLSSFVGVTQLAGNIRGGLPVGSDGRVHCTFTSNPSTLRSACQQPNLQQIPRVKGPTDDASIIRKLFIAKEGSTFGMVDYSGIEARLVGYFAGDPDYIRLTGIDVHSFYTAYGINALDGRIKGSDLPQLSWDNVRLTAYLKQIKKEFKEERNNLFKHLVHAKNFAQKAKGAQEKILLETGIMYPLPTIQRVMDLYDELFPKIPKWQWNTLLQVEKEGFLRNPFGYVSRFTRPFEYTKMGKEWDRKPGIDSNKIFAFLPQSTAAGIIKEAMLRLFNDRFEEAGQYLRLLIHDELFLECPDEEIDRIIGVVIDEMSKPILQMPLPESFNMGPYLTIGVEAKRGKRWGLA